MQTSIPIQSLQVHPALALMPDLRGEKWKQFVDRVRENGVTEPISVQDSLILDGKKRWRASLELGQETIPARKVNLSPLDQILFIMQATALRQHLSDDQRAIIGARIRKPLSAQLKADRARKAGSAGGRGRKGRGIACGLHKATSYGSREIVAREMGVSRKLLEKAIEVETKATDLAEKVLTGRLTLIVACREMRGRFLRDELVALGAPLACQNYRLIFGDCFNVEIESNSISLMFADPPYGNGLVDRCEKLAYLASRILKPGGSLLVMTGQLWMPEILAAMSIHLRYHWIVSYDMPGGSARPMFALRVNPHWKAVLWYTKGEPSLSRIVNDVCRSNRQDKSLHDWQQSEQGILNLVEQFSEPGQIVLDPMCGSATTGVACLRLGRRFIGVDKDERAIQMSAGRLAKLAE